MATRDERRRRDGYVGQYLLLFPLLHLSFFHSGLLFLSSLLFSFGLLRCCLVAVIIFEEIEIHFLPNRIFPPALNPTRRFFLSFELYLPQSCETDKCFLLRMLNEFDIEGNITSTLIRFLADVSQYCSSTCFANAVANNYPAQLVVSKGVEGGRKEGWITPVILEDAVGGVGRQGRVYLLQWIPLFFE